VPQATRRLPPADREIAEVLDGVRRLDRGLRLAARNVERATGLSAAQLFALKHLRDGTALSLSELAGRTYTDRSSVSVVVDRLVDAALVTRATDPADRRRAQIRISAAGRRMLDRAPDAPTDLLLQALATLPESTVTSLGSSLARLNAALGFTETEMLFGTR